jgi:hypothetical protein
VLFLAALEDTDPWVVALQADLDAFVKAQTVTHEAQTGEAICDSLWSMARRLFISYAHSDGKELAQRLTADLRSRGH